MTYAGLKSMIYAQVPKDDVRVKAAIEWIGRHFTFAENPGMGDAGLYYYLHTCAKALAAVGKETLVDAHGRSHDWRSELIRQLLSTQRADGHWLNANGRWWESVPELTTSYSVLALQIAMGPARAD